MRVAAVVPALNEAKRIGTVLAALGQAHGLDEIVVVDDASTDGTLVQIPQGNGLRAVRLERNRGKAGALLAGARATNAEILLFMDADLVGVQGKHIDLLLAPVVAGAADMSIAVFRGGRLRTDWAQKLVPYISGQRALRREFFLSLPRLEQARFGVEVALTLQARLQALRVDRVPWYGVTHVMKEEKLGLARGLAERAKMYWQIGAYLAQYGRNGAAHYESPAGPSEAIEVERAPNRNE